MKPRDIFRIIVATAGLIFFSLGLIGIIAAVINGIAPSPTPRAPTGPYTAISVVELILGVMIMKGYPPLTDIAFPPEEPPKTQDDETKPDA